MRMGTKSSVSCQSKYELQIGKPVWKCHRSYLYRQILVLCHSLPGRKKVSFGSCDTSDFNAPPHHYQTTWTRHTVKWFTKPKAPNGGGRRSGCSRTSDPQNGFSRNSVQTLSFFLKILMVSISSLYFSWADRAGGYFFLKNAAPLIRSSCCIHWTSVLASWFRIVCPSCWLTQKQTKNESTSSVNCQYNSTTFDRHLLNILRRSQFSKAPTPDTIW